jgi:nicotinamide-nucleotide amidase
MAVPTDTTLLALVRRLAVLMLAEDRVLATAESCTGGLIAKCVTDLPGSSSWFERGWVTYSNRAKQEDLGVGGGLLKRHGAVSEPVARAMARGALRASGADGAVAVTGIAGPDGAAAAKPVGTVWIAWARRRGRGMRVEARLFRFAGPRDAVRRQTAAAALKGLLEA